jgi:hypothetical protein
VRAPSLTRGPAAIGIGAALMKSLGRLRRELAQFDLLDFPGRPRTT